MEKHLNSLARNQSYKIVKDNHYSINLSNKNNFIKLPWWQEGAKGDGIEFIFSSKKTTNTGSLVESSGSENRKLWDVFYKKR